MKGGELGEISLILVDFSFFNHAFFTKVKLSKLINTVILFFFFEN